MFVCSPHLHARARNQAAGGGGADAAPIKPVAGCAPANRRPQLVSPPPPPPPPLSSGQGRNANQRDHRLRRRRFQTLKLQAAERDICWPTDIRPLNQCHSLGPRERAMESETSGAHCHPPTSSWKCEFDEVKVSCAQSPAREQNCPKLGGTAQTPILIHLVKLIVKLKFNQTLKLFPFDFVRLFCAHFIAYQLETLSQLVVVGEHQINMSAGHVQHHSRRPPARINSAAQIESMNTRRQIQPARRVASQPVALLALPRELPTFGPTPNLQQANLRRVAPVVVQSRAWSSESANTSGISILADDSRLCVSMDTSAKVPAAGHVAATQPIAREPNIGTNSTAKFGRTKSASSWRPASVGQVRRQVSEQSAATGLQTRPKRAEEQTPSSPAKSTGSGLSLAKISLAGATRRLGFKRRVANRANSKRPLDCLHIHRSEEVLPSQLSGGRQANAVGHFANCSFTSASSSSSPGYRAWQNQNYAAAELLCTGAQSRAGHLFDSLNDSELATPSDEHTTPGNSFSLSQHSNELAAPPPPPPLANSAKFVDGLGAGQIASRQAFVAPYLGDIQLSLCDQRGLLEVEVIRARQLQLKPSAKQLPAPFVKIYLMRKKKCLAKFKTTQVASTLDPMFQQRFMFRDDYSGCVLQVIVWGDYGKRDRKSLMGIVQIHLDELDISNVIVNWYKLLNVSSLVDATLRATTSLPVGRLPDQTEPKRALAPIGSLISASVSSKTLRQTISSTKLSESRILSDERPAECESTTFEWY